MHSIHERSAVDRFCRRRRIDPYHVRRLRHAFYRDGRDAESALGYLPPEDRDAFRQAFRFQELTLIDCRDSRQDGASKLVLRTASGRSLESVILRSRTGRTTLCVSSQIGCAARCRFCATGFMEGVRNLSAAEILDQVSVAARLLAGEGRRIRNVVFMGMGEPLHNEAAVVEALDTLLSDHGFAYAARRLLVSTVGVPAAMIRLADRFPRLPLALSLHSARPEVRQQLIPVARHHGLGELRSVLEHVTRGPFRPVLIEYLTLRDVNDGPEDARCLADFLQGLKVHVNLIPYNRIDAAPELRTTDRPQRDQFASWLREAGLSVTIRYSLGDDVAAACGQLAVRDQKAPQITSSPILPDLAN